MEEGMTRPRNPKLEDYNDSLRTFSIWKKEIIIANSRPVKHHLRPACPLHCTEDKNAAPTPRTIPRPLELLPMEEIPETSEYELIQKAHIEGKKADYPCIFGYPLREDDN